MDSVGTPAGMEMGSSGLVGMGSVEGKSHLQYLSGQNPDMSTM